MGEHAASVTEDPVNRRINSGSGRRQLILHLVPMSRPEVVNTPEGPAVLHAGDFTPVMTARPARTGETLSLIVSDLGPTYPRLDPGEPFPSGPRHKVNSPVEVTVNGQPAEVIDAVGYPEMTNTYVVNFRLPGGIAPGIANLRVSAAWIAGAEVSFPVQ